MAYGSILGQTPNLANVHGILPVENGGTGVDNLEDLSSQIGLNIGAIKGVYKTVNLSNMQYYEDGVNGGKYKQVFSTSDFVPYNSFMMYVKYDNVHIQDIQSGVFCISSQLRNSGYIWPLSSTLRGATTISSSGFAIIVLTEGSLSLFPSRSSQGLYANAPLPITTNNKLSTPLYVLVTYVGRNIQVSGTITLGFLYFDPNHMPS